MKKEEALKLAEELKDLIGEYPSENEWALKRCEQIRFTFKTDENSNGYIREKMTEVNDDMSCWFSQRKWQKYTPDNPNNFKIRTLSSVSRLKMAIQSFHKG